MPNLGREDKSESEEKVKGELSGWGLKPDYKWVKVLYFVFVCCIHNVFYLFIFIFNYLANVKSQVVMGGSRQYPRGHTAAVDTCRVCTGTGQQE